MKNINAHIQNRSFQNVYLLYGPEDYLRHQYRDRLRTAILPAGDTVNYNAFEGKQTDVAEVIRLAETMPFFADYRLIVLQETGFFSSAANELADYVKKIPASTILVFDESTADKRTRLFKAVSSAGYAACMEHPDMDTLVKWIVTLLNQEHKKMTKKDCQFFLSLIDNDMYNIRHELEKLICYTMDRTVITRKDIELLCCVHTENRIFDMVRAIGDRDTAQAVSLYRDLLTLHEKPMRILALIARQYNHLLQIRELLDQGRADEEIALAVGQKVPIVRRNKKLALRFSQQELVEALADCVQMEEDVKSGRLQDTIAVELLICR